MINRLLSGLGVALAVAGFFIATPAAAQVVADYRFTAGFNDYIGMWAETEVWARVYRPTFSGTQKYPLIVMLHGNHRSCGTGSNPRVDNDDSYALSGSCPANYSMVKSHEGYAYLANDLASRGYIVVSISAHRGFPIQSGPTGDEALLRTRGRLVLWHLTMLDNWNRGIVSTPSSLGVSLKDRIDFSQVGLMGHSRGALGMRAAIEAYRDPNNSTWRELIPSMTIRSLLEISPPAEVGGETPIKEAKDISFLGMVGLCDGDLVSTGNGANVVSKHFDRLMQTTSGESGTYFKAQYGINGANHNYFNTQWQQNDSKVGCTNQTPLFTGSSTETGSQSQRDSALTAVSAFFRATVGNSKDPSLAKIFDPAYAAPSGPTLARSFTPSPSRSLWLETFTYPTGTNFNEVANNSSGLTKYAHITGIFQHNNDYPSAILEWGSASSSKYFQTNWRTSGGGWNLSGYNYLEFRVEQTESSTLTGPVEFNVQLVNSDNTRSSSVSSGSYATLPLLPATQFGEPIAGGGTNILHFYHPMLRTIRIPLTAFTNANLNSIRGVRFVFNRTSNGKIYLASIRASNDNNLARGRTVTVSSTQDNNSTLNGSKAVDGSTGTRWSSAFSDSQWIYVDLGSSKSFKTVILRWEAAYGRNFKIQTSTNASTWTDVHAVTNGTGGTQIISLASTATGRYVRMLGSARGTQYGYSLYEFEIYPN